MLVRSLIRLAVLGIAGLFYGCATLPEPVKPKIQQNNFDYARENLNWMIQREMKKEKLAGLSIALVYKDAIIWEQGFGFSDIDQSTRVDQHTLFRAGSLTKMLNAIAIMQAVEQEKIALDDPVKNYIPELDLRSQSGPSSPTIRELLYHHGGLPSDQILGMWVHSPQHYRSVLDYLNRVAMPYTPGTRFNYSNLGHDVLGIVLERVNHKPYDQIVASMLEQLGMQNALVTAHADSPPTALGYNKKSLKSELNLRDVPAAGLTASAHDLALLLKEFTHTPSLLKPKSFRTLLRNQASAHPLNLNRRVGLGFMYFDGIFHRGQRIYGHSGATVNHRALIKFSHAHQYGVVLLSNSRNASPALHRIANKALKLMHEAHSGKPAPVQHAYWPKAKTDDQLTKSDLLGHYATRFGLASIFKKGDKLKARLAGKSFSLFKRQEDGLFYVEYKLMGIIPINLGYIGLMGLSVRKIEGEAYLVGTNTVGNETLLGQKVSPTPIHPAWEKRLGNYKVATPIEVIDLPKGGLKIEEGFLIAHAVTDRGQKLNVVLKTLNDSQALALGIGRGFGETVYVIEQNGEEFLEYSAVQFKKISN